MAAPWLGIRGHPRPAIDRGLEDQGGGVRIDALGTLGAAEILFDHRAFGGLRRPAFVPHQDRQVQVGQIAGHGAGRLAARARAAVHVERQADDQCLDRAFGDDLGDLGLVLRELAPDDGLACRGKAPARIAQRHADGLGAGVEPHQDTAHRQGGTQVGSTLGNHEVAVIRVWGVLSGHQLLFGACRRSQA
jgi:hypothetical protein